METQCKNGTEFWGNGIIREAGHLNQHPIHSRRSKFGKVKPRIQGWAKFKLITKISRGLAKSRGNLYTTYEAEAANRSGAHTKTSKYTIEVMRAMVTVH
jgi:hypothetical protein